MSPKRMGLISILADAGLSQQFQSPAEESAVLDYDTKSLNVAHELRAIANVDLVGAVGYDDLAARAGVRAIFLTGDDQAY
jgi:hypothetical protein